jgi:hypothetical protein
MSSTTVYIVLFSWASDGEEIARLYFASLEAIPNRLPEIIALRLESVADAIEANPHLSPEGLCAFLAYPRNLCRHVEVGGNILAVCGVETVLH